LSTVYATWVRFVTWKSEKDGKIGTHKNEKEKQMKRYVD